jgi:PIN domain nuclease of toxin-antitoxin system
VRYLLDTRTWLWLLETPGRIRPDLVAEFGGRQTQLFLSAAASWEIAIKWALGRMPLAIEHAHALQVATLPRHHGDPFDRLLVAQAQVEHLPIVTVDTAFDDYDVEVVKAA